MSRQVHPHLQTAQIAMQYISLALIGGLTVTMLGWTLAAATGFLPWLDLAATIGSAPVTRSSTGPPTMGLRSGGRNS